MRSLIAALFFCLSFFALSPAYAGFASDYGRDSYSSHVRGATRRATRGHRSAVAAVNVDYGFAAVRHIGDAAYALAVSQGGPCGLTVERIVFGRSDHMIGNFNPWLSWAWAVHFERAPVAVGMVVVWPPSRRTRGHVEVIAAVHPDGRISTNGSVGFHHISAVGLIVVDPHRSRHRFAGA